MKAWLKGGLIGVGIGILGFFLSLIASRIFGSPSIFFIFLALLYIYAMYLPPHYFGQVLGQIFIFLAIGLTYFIIGAIIGWIIGKIKSKNSEEIR